MVVDLKSTVDLLEQTIGEEPDLYLVWLLDETGNVERLIWDDKRSADGELSGDVPILKQVGSIITSLKDTGKLTECAGFVGYDGVIRKVIVERVKNRFNLVVFGAGHVGRSVAQLGATVGYKTLLVDDREEILSSGRLKECGIAVERVDFERGVSHLSVGGESAVVIVTRGHQYDELCLRYVLNSSAFYVGMIGSKRRVLSIFRKLEIEGYSAERLRSVFAPIGLRIGAVTPQEIAVAIIAEIICCLRGVSLEGACHLKV